MRMPQGRPKTRREFSRFPAAIPVRIEIVHAWEGTTFSSLLGILFNLSRGGAGMRLQRVLPPRTRLRLSVPAGPEELCLVAEIVWTSVVPGLGPEPATYGVRWVEQLSSKSLGTILPLPRRPEEGAGAPPRSP